MRFGESEERLLATVRRTAKIIDSSPSRTYSLIARGVIPHIRIDGGIRVPIDALKKMIDDKLRKAGEEGGE